MWPCPELTPAHQKNLDEKLVLNCSDDIYKKFTKDELIQKLVSAIHFAEKGRGGRCAVDCATSHAGASGPMQFMPLTWNAYHCEGMDDRNNLEHAICGGTNYLTKMIIAEARKNPDMDTKGVIWKAAYSYNAGYSRPSTRAGGIPGGVVYADLVIAEMERMNAKF